MKGHISVAMTEALRLVARGVPIRQAARQAGVHWTSLHKAINRNRIVAGMAAIAKAQGRNLVVMPATDGPIVGNNPTGIIIDEVLK